MEIGVKFCGGCNPRYNRGAALERIKKELPDVTWVSGSQPVPCDYWFLVCGCMRECINENLYPARKEVIKFSSFASFNGVADKIKKAATEKKVVERKVLHIGDQASLKKVISRDMVFQFAELTGDDNKMHVNDGFAAEQWFQKPVAHGMLSANLLSTVMGTMLPGDGTIIMETQTKFHKPVFFEDEITATITLKEVDEQKRFMIGTFEGVCTNQNGDVVTEMTTKQMMMKNLFELAK